MATLHGRDAHIYIGIAAGIAHAEGVEWSIDVDFDTVNDAAFGDTWETFLKGQLRWNGSLAGHLDTASTNLFDVAVSTSQARLYLYPDRARTARYYYGTCWPKLSVRVSRPDRVSIALSFQGTGQLATN